MPKPFRVADVDLVPRLQRGALPRCKNSHRSAIAAVSPEGGSSWMSAEELEPLFGGSSILAKAEGDLEPLFGGSSILSQRWMAAALRRRGGFPQLYGAASAFPVNLGCTGREGEGEREGVFFPLSSLASASSLCCHSHHASARCAGDRSAPTCTLAGASVHEGGQSCGASWLARRRTRSTSWMCQSRRSIRNSWTVRRSYHWNASGACSRSRGSRRRSLRASRLPNLQNLRVKLGLLGPEQVTRPAHPLQLPIQQSQSMLVKLALL